MVWIYFLFIFCLANLFLLLLFFDRSLARSILINFLSFFLFIFLFDRLLTGIPHPLWLAARFGEWRIKITRLGTRARLALYDMDR